MACTSAETSPAASAAVVSAAFVSAAVVSAAAVSAAFVSATVVSALPEPEHPVTIAAVISPASNNAIFFFIMSPPHFPFSLLCPAVPCFQLCRPEII